MIKQLNKELDCQGLSCPLPILKTRKAMDELSSGQILKLVCTDPSSIDDFTSWSSSTGHILLSSNKQDEIYIYLIQKK